MPGGASLDISSCPSSIEQEIADLQQQLQSMKKQTVTVLEQSRKSSDREQTALRQAQEALELKETATANAAQSAQRENYMLDLMTDASQDMAGTLLLSRRPFAVFMYLFLCYIVFSLVLPPSQNIRRLRIGQKSNITNFDQIFRKIYLHLQYRMDILKKYT